MGREVVETAVFAFGTDAVGNRASIQVNVTHNANDSSGNPCLPGGETSDFSICVPKITVANNGFVYNEARGFNFNDTVSISGLDDLSQVDIEQLISSDSDFTDNDGSDARPAGWPDNTSGFIVDAAGGSGGWNWHTPYSGGNGDNQAFATATYSTITIGSTPYDYSRLGYTFRDFEVFLRRHADKCTGLRARLGLHLR